jgi:xanthine dehydrogenase small subunit
MRDHVLLFINGERVELRGADADQPLTDLLRHRLGATGTKVVCAEGDCGACTALVARPGPDGLRYRAIDACIQFCWQLDGASILTVEGLADGDRLHPAQAAMITHHGSQCGYCTPGFVMAIAGHRESGEPTTPASVDLALSGNLCRCTGYTSIRAAALAQAELHAPALSERYSAPAMVRALTEAAATGAHLRWDGADGPREVRLPTTLPDALAARAGATVWAGGTDLGVQRNKGRPAPLRTVSLAHVEALRGITFRDDEVEIGAATPWSTVLAWAHDALPPLASVLELFGAPQIREAGTVGGNLVNASPIADATPCWLALDAVVHVASAAGARSVPIASFFLGYKQVDLRPDEIVTHLTLRLPGPHQRLQLYKVSRRLDLDISSVTAAFRLDLDGETIRAARVAFGGVAATSIRMTEVETSLTGAPLQRAVLHAAGVDAAARVRPISDVRASEAYRRHVVRNLFRKLAHDLEVA